MVAFQIEDLADLLRLLHEHPEWRDQLRAAILPSEVLALPQSIAEVVEMQKRFQQMLEAHNERLDRLEQTVAQLVEAQLRFQQTLEEHSRQIQENSRQMERLQQTVQAHNERLDRLEQTVAELAETVRNLVRVVEALDRRMAKVSGFYYEFHYRERAPAYFGRILRRTRELLPQDIEHLVEPYLSDEERADFYRTDAIVRGLWQTDEQEIYFVTEVSETVDTNDVVRALQRTDLLRKAGLRALPAVAGSNATEEARALASREKVLLVTDGTMENLEAVQQSLNAGS